MSDQIERLMAAVDKADSMISGVTTREEIDEVLGPLGIDEPMRVAETMVKAAQRVLSRCAISLAAGDLEAVESKLGSALLAMFFTGYFYKEQQEED